jgi:hypothetical protein
MNGSSATAYRYSLVAPRTEADPLEEKGFSPDVTREWEAALFDGETPGTRRIALRTSLVLGRGAPVMDMLLRLARLGSAARSTTAGGSRTGAIAGIGAIPPPDRPDYEHSTGRQRLSWMHEQDFVQAVQFLRDHDEIAGPVNMASPNAVTNIELMRTLRRAVAPFGAGAALRAGAGDGGAAHRVGARAQEPLGAAAGARGRRVRVPLPAARGRRAGHRRALTAGPIAPARTSSGS